MFSNVPPSGLLLESLEPIDSLAPDEATPSDMEPVLVNLCPWRLRVEMGLPRFQWDDLCRFFTEYAPPLSPTHRSIGHHV